MNTFTLPAESASGRTEEEKLANIALSPEFKAAVTSKAYAPAIGEQDLAAVLERLGEVTSRVVSGDTKDVESMLAAQALTLDSIFHKLALHAERNIGQHQKAVDCYLRLALKAQSQCRATAETLANFKSPRQYISQTNVAGTMQVNFDLENSHVDRRAQSQDAASDSTMEALGKINGTTDVRRKSGLQQKRSETRSILGIESEIDFRDPKATTVSTSQSQNQKYALPLTCV